MLLACVADDTTGATDCAVNIARAGLSVVQVNGVPDPASAAPDADAIVVALKSRTAPPAQAIEQSVAAARWLRSHGAPSLYFKICSTFDSTPAGNIGPVADALLALTGGTFALVTPAYPRNQRTVYRGHLFVGDALLSDTGMRTHPLTPMTDANLVRVLAAQTPHAVGLLALDALRADADAAISTVQARGVRYAIADAVADDDLDRIAAPAAELALNVGGAGLAAALARRVARGVGPKTSRFVPAGPVGVLAGSCSPATLAQLAALHGRWPMLALDPIALARDGSALDAASGWLATHAGTRPFVVHASAAPAAVAHAQRALGAARAAQLVEQALQRLAREAVGAGVRRLVVAGGETSGAVIDALGIRQLAIGEEIAPGVPWTRALDAMHGGAIPASPIGGLFLACKSGNFGDDDFFLRAAGEAP